MEAITYYSLIALAVAIFVTTWFVYGERINRLDVADEAWGLAQPFIVIVAISLTKSTSSAAYIMLAATAIWGYRLYSHLRIRHKQNRTEDVRYTDMRTSWQTHPKLQAYLYVFALQGALMYLLGFGSILLVRANPDLQLWSLCGIAIWIFGFVFEMVSDRELANFIRDPQNKGKVMDRGLWAYSRHPNYFGEVTMWWGLFVFILINTGSWLTIVSPLIITYLIVFVSGIPLTEKHFEGNPAWGTYKEKTSALIPWFKGGK